MNDKRHTHGPWAISTRTAEIANVGQYTGNPDDATMEVVTVRAGMNEIAYVPSADEANARLIAAAPELLQLVQRFTTAGLITTYQETCRDALAVLARVQGEG